MTDKIDYSLFKKALLNLELQYKNLTTLTNEETLIVEAVQESVIQRFEICCDLTWKILKKYLSKTLGLPDVPNAPKPIFRLAYENKMLSSDMNFWLNYIDIRNSTSHDYNGEKAKAAIELMEHFINDIINLYEKMSNEQWKI
ncbi:MAG: HI0074 family nucleotidyltransferase substrate-binding subunit [Candidatus Gastranaerophilales bacterium]